MEESKQTEKQLIDDYMSRSDEECTEYNFVTVSGDISWISELEDTDQSELPL